MLLLRSQLGGDSSLHRRVMIIGAGEAGQIILRDIKHSEKVDERVYCMIDDNPNKWNRYIDGVPVVGVNITVRQSRQSGVARATCPD